MSRKLFTRSIQYFFPTQELIKILEEAGQEVPDELIEMADKYARWKEREDEGRKFAGNGGGKFERKNLGNLKK